MTTTDPYDNITSAFASLYTLACLVEGTTSPVSDEKLHRHVAVIEKQLSKLQTAMSLRAQCGDWTECGQCTNGKVKTVDIEDASFGPSFDCPACNGVGLVSVSSTSVRMVPMSLRDDITAAIAGHRVHPPVNAADLVAPLTDAVMAVIDEHAERDDVILAAIECLR